MTVILLLVTVTSDGLKFICDDRKCNYDCRKLTYDDLKFARLNLNKIFKKRQWLEAPKHVQNMSRAFQTESVLKIHLQISSNLPPPGDESSIWNILARTKPGLFDVELGLFVQIC